MKHLLLISLLFCSGLALAQIDPVNIGSAPNDGTGDNLRAAFTKVNANDDYLDDTKAPLASPALTGTPTAPTAANGTSTTQVATTAFVMSSAPKRFGVALSDMTTQLTAGTLKAYFRMPVAMTVTAVRASVATAQSAGSIVTVDINENGTSILSTKLTIDNSEKTSTTAAAAAVISDTALADDAEITFDIDAAGTGGAGLIVWIIGY